MLCICTCSTCSTCSTFHWPISPCRHTLTVPSSGCKTQGIQYPMDTNPMDTRHTVSNGHKAYSIQWTQGIQYPMTQGTQYPMDTRHTVSNGHKAYSIQWTQGIQYPMDTRHGIQYPMDTRHTVSNGHKAYSFQWTQGIQYPIDTLQIMNVATYRANKCVSYTRLQIVGMTSIELRGVEEQCCS